MKEDRSEKKVRPGNAQLYWESCSFYAWTHLERDGVNCPFFWCTFLQYDGDRHCVSTGISE